MLQKLKLRWKILIALVGLSLSPLILTLVFFSGFTGHVIREDMATLAEKSANFVERSIASAQEERVNYIGLLAGSSDLVNAAYYAALTGDAGQLQDLVQEARQHYGFDAIQVLAADGTLLLHSEGGDGSAEASDLTLPALRLSLDGKTGAGIGSFMGRLSITVATPVRLQGQAIAHLVGATFLDDAFAARIKALSGAGIAFYDGDGFTAGSDPGLKALSRDEVIGRGEVRAELDGRSHLLFSKPFGESGGGILLALDRSRELDSQRSMRMMVAAILVVALIAAIGIGLAFSGRLVGSLTEVVVTLEEIAAGEGDLTRSLAVRSGDEVGALASNFNRFVARLRAMVEQTRQAVTSLSGATAQIRQASQGVTDGARSQAESLEESFQAIQGIEESIAGIAESTGSLVQSAEESSSATMELGATIEEIAGQMEKLFQTVIEVSSSISQMSVSSQQIAENIEILSSSTEVTASSITELDASIKEIEENARTTNQLAEAAAQDADQGKATVDETIRGISAIRDSVDRAGAVIRDLGSQSHAIGRILTVIDEVADQTSLLALNAAIIAAQAGEHGRGFAVVADEIRQLADRTAVSTREIAAIITSLQEGTTEAVQAMAVGSERVNQEVARSQAAGEALEKIRTSTLKATEQVRSIMLSTREQARGSQQITSAINQVTMMLGQIATAVRQQNEGTRQLARATEAMEEIASQGKRSTSEQAKGSRQITASVERIRVMIERIDEATRGQSRRTREVVEAVSKIRSIAESTAGRTGELDQAVEILIAQSDSLAGEVGAFRT